MAIPAATNRLTPKGGVTIPSETQIIIIIPSVMGLTLKERITGTKIGVSTIMAALTDIKQPIMVSKTISASRIPAALLKIPRNQSLSILGTRLVVMIQLNPSASETISIAEAAVIPDSINIFTMSLNLISLYTSTPRIKP